MPLSMLDSFQSIINQLRQNIALYTVEAHLDNQTLLTTPLDTVGNYCLLHKAAESGDLDAVKIILESYPDKLDQKNKFNKTPLLFAASSGQIEVARYLISLGADFDLAAQFSNFAEKESIERDALVLWPQVECLLKAGAPITLPALQKKSFRIFLYHTSEPEIARILANNPALLTIIIDDDLPMLHKYVLHGCLEQLKIILTVNPGLRDYLDGWGQSCLILAAAEGYVKIVKYLLSLGANLNVTTHCPNDKSNKINGRTARHWALAEENYVIYRMLVKAAESPSFFAQKNASQRIGTRLTVEDKDKEFGWVNQFSG